MQQQVHASLSAAVRVGVPFHSSEACELSGSFFPLYVTLTHIRNFIPTVLSKTEHAAAVAVSTCCLSF